MKTLIKILAFFGGVFLEIWAFWIFFLFVYLFGNNKIIGVFLIEWMELNTNKLFLIPQLLFILIKIFSNKLLKSDEN